MKQKKQFVLTFLSLTLIFYSQLTGTATTKNSPEEEKNTNQVKRLIDHAWNNGKIEILDELIDNNCVFYINGELIDKIGPDYMKFAIEQNQANFPGYHLTITDIIAKESKVIVIYQFQGIYQKLRKPVTLDTVLVNHFNNGKITKSWTFSNQLSTLKQLGFQIIPPSIDNPDQPANPQQEPPPIKK